MAKKKSRAQEAEEFEQYLKHHRFVSTPNIKTKYPNVAEIKLTLDFRNEDFPAYGKHEFSRALLPEHTAAFDVDCINHECVRGGFDLGREVAAMIKDNLVQSEGTKTCQGWQDKERINKHQCLIKLDYKIQIQYIPST